MNKSEVSFDFWREVDRVRGALGREHTKALVFYGMLLSSTENRQLCSQLIHLLFENDPGRAHQTSCVSLRVLPVTSTSIQQNRIFRNYHALLDLGHEHFSEMRIPVLSPALFCRFSTNIQIIADAADCQREQMK